jgi:hypothetical protein
MLGRAVLCPLPIDRSPKYRKHHASGQAVVTLDSRDFYLGLWNSKASCAEYDRLIAEWLANGRGTSASVTDISVAELIERFWGHARCHQGNQPEAAPTVHRPRGVSAQAMALRIHSRSLHQFHQFGVARLTVVVRQKLVEAKERWEAVASPVQLNQLVGMLVGPSIVTADGRLLAANQKNRAHS